MKIKNNFVLKKIAGSYVVVPVRTRAVDFSGIIKLTESGAFLWKLLEKGADREELIKKMLEEYVVDEATAAADIDRFVAKLREADLIE
ncbi:PqqD family protein [Ruminococcus sp.]|uniref:PqqD family protein n=1 Tax=Ruminococcus sp. TaxID=41978 RepID=UPI0038669E69